MTFDFRVVAPTVVSQEPRSAAPVIAWAITGVLAELKGIRESPVTDQELAEAKAFLMGSFPLRLDSTAKLAQVLAQVEFYGLGFEYFSQYPKWIDRVTKEDVQRVARQYLDPQHYALVVVGNIAKAKIRQ